MEPVKVIGHMLRDDEWYEIVSVEESDFLDSDANYDYGWATVGWRRMRD